MTEEGHGDLFFPENVEDDLNKLFIHTVFEAGTKSTILGPDEVIEDFALVLSEKVAGK